MQDDFYIGQIFYDKYPPEAANWCNKNNALIEEKHKQEETEQGVVDVRYYEIINVPEPVAPTEEEQRGARSTAYRIEVDSITAHIQRLRDKEQTEEVVAEITALIAERDEKVAAIKERYPYPVGE